MTVRITYVGNYGPAHSTETHVARSLEALGCHVERVQENNTAAVRALERRAGRIDLLLYTRTWDLPADRAETIFRAVEANGGITAAYHLDRFVGLPRETEILTQTMFKVGHVFTADGAPATEAAYAAAGVNHHWLPAGVVHDECGAGTYRRKWAGRVAFVGSRGYHPEWLHRPALVDWLHDTYQEALVKAGDGNPASDPRQMPGRERVRGADLNDLYASVDVAVGDSLLLHGSGDRYWSDRVYETLGRGGLLIHPQVDALDDEFDGLLPSWPLGDFDALEQEIRRWTDDPPARRSRLEQLRAIVAERCTYKARMSTLLETVGLR